MIEPWMIPEEKQKERPVLQLPLPEYLPEEPKTENEQTVQRGVIIISL